MVKKDENCWEFWEKENNGTQKCKISQRKKCPAYTLNSGKECWYIASQSCPHEHVKVKYCWECLFFKKMNPKQQNI